MGKEEVDLPKIQVKLVLLPENRQLLGSILSWNKREPGENKDQLDRDKKRHWDNITNSIESAINYKVNEGNLVYGQEYIYSIEGQLNKIFGIKKPKILFKICVKEPLEIKALTGFKSIFTDFGLG